MTSIPALSDLIREVILDGLAGARDPIRQIGEAERLAGEFNHLGERLVGYFVEQARAEGLSWADIGAPRGLSRQGAQQKYAPFVAHLTVAELMEAGALRQFGEAALAAIRRAEGHAARLGRDAIDSGDLLLGVLDDPGSAAVAALEELGVDPASLRAELALPDRGRTEAPNAPAATGGAATGGAGASGSAAMSDLAAASGATATSGLVGPRMRPASGPAGSGPAGSGPAVIGVVPLGAEARRSLDAAVAEARGHLVAPGHLLLGVLRNPAGRAGRLLGAHGVTKASAVGAIIAVGSRQSTGRAEA